MAQLDKDDRMCEVEKGYISYRECLKTQEGDKFWYCKLCENRYLISETKPATH